MKSIKNYLQQYGFNVVAFLIDRDDNNDDNNEICCFSDIDCLANFIKEHKISILINTIYLDKNFCVCDPKDIDLVKKKIDLSYKILNAVNDFCQIHKEGFSYFALFPNSIFGSQDEGCFCSEISLPDPQTHNAAMLANAFFLHKIYRRKFSLPIIQIVVGNLYGKGIDFNSDIFHTVIANALKRENILIYGNGKKERNWLHINDFSYMLYLTIFKNVCAHCLCFAGENELFINFVKKICQKFDVYCAENSLDYEASSLLKFSSSAQKSNTSYAMKANQTNELLKYKSKFTLENSLDELIIYYIDQLLASN